MNFIKLKCVNQNVDLNDYLKLYTYVKKNMQHPEWLGTFSMNEIKDEMLINSTEIARRMPELVKSIQETNLVDFFEKFIISLFIS